MNISYFIVKELHVNSAVLYNYIPLLVFFFFFFCLVISQIEPVR